MGVKPSRSTRPSQKSSPRKPSSGMYGVIPLTKAGSKKKTRK